MHFFFSSCETGHVKKAGDGLTPSNPQHGVMCCLCVTAPKIIADTLSIIINLEKSLHTADTVGTLPPNYLVGYTVHVCGIGKCQAHSTPWQIGEAGGYTVTL